MTQQYYQHKILSTWITKEDLEKIFPLKLTEEEKMLLERMKEREERNHNETAI